MFDSSVLHLSAAPIAHATESDCLNSFRQSVSYIMQDRNDEETVYSIEGFTLFVSPLPLDEEQAKLNHGDRIREYYDDPKTVTATSSEKKQYLSKVGKCIDEHQKKIINFFLKKAKVNLQLVYQETHNSRISIFNCIDYDAVLYVVHNPTAAGQQKVVRTTLSFATLNASLYSVVKKFCDSNFVDLTSLTSASESKVNLLSRDSTRFFFNTFALQKHPFLSAAFSQKNNEFFGSIVDKLASKKPYGRIHIFHGPPGTGKTSFIKSLITETLEKFSSIKEKEKKRYFDSRKIVFVYIPVSTFSFFSSPEAVGTLLDEGFSETSRIIFVIEDADNIIKKRVYDGDDKDTLSNLLNFCDGITGQIFDIQCIVTSNIALDKIDPAFIRPGRLGSLVHFDVFSEDEKRRFCKEFEIDVPEGAKSLAELFEVVNTKKFLEEQNAVEESLINKNLLQPDSGSDKMDSAKGESQGAENKKSKKRKK